jgi:hypothetical protein
MCCRVTRAIIHSMDDRRDEWDGRLAVSIELARVRLRGIYAVIAGALIVIGIPLFESAFLAPVGYVTAADAAAQHGDFAPLLAWIATYPGPDLAFHIVEIVPFLLVLPLPLNLWRVLRPVRAGERRPLAVYVGAAGFACYALATAIGTATSLRGASAYAAGSHASAVSGFVFAFGAQNLLSHVAGGLLVAAFLAMTGIACMRSRSERIPPLLGAFGLLAALLLGITALLFLAGPAQVEVPTGTLSFAALAFWLGGVGIILARLKTLPTPPTPAETDATAGGDSASRDSSDAGPSHRAAGRSARG